MNVGGWRAGIDELLGASPDRVSEDDLRRLVASAIKEQPSLDYKREDYGAGDAQKRELAADVAALANDRGGVLIIGIEEKDETAVSLSPVELLDGREASIRQTVAAHVAPHLLMAIHVVPAGAPGYGYYLIEVPPSTLRPHAVLKDRDLRYPRRDGTTKRWLSEAEVADLYRDRFGMASGQTGRVEEVLDAGSQALDESFRPCLQLAAVPVNGSTFPITREQVKAFEAWGQSLGAADWWTGFFAPGVYANGRVRQGRITLNKPRSDQSPYGEYLELWRDGATFAAHQFIDARGPQAEGDSHWIFNEHLLWAIAQSLRASALHARDHAAAFGDLLVEAMVIGSNMTLAYLGPHNFVDQVEGGETISSFAATRHTVSLDAIAQSDTELLAATRLVAIDLYNAFGSAEILHLTLEGELRIAYFRRYAEEITALAKRRNVAITQDTVAH